MKKQAGKDQASCKAETLRAQMAEASAKNPDDFETGTTPKKTKNKEQE
ncbi:MAG: hypothetical protein ACYCX4_15190 [Bacillota bacterium]